jgi:hypothetical protein
MATTKTDIKTALNSRNAVYCNLGECYSFIILTLYNTVKMGGANYNFCHKAISEPHSSITLKYKTQYSVCQELSQKKMETPKYTSESLLY